MHRYLFELLAHPRVNIKRSNGIYRVYVGDWPICEATRDDIVAALEQCDETVKVKLMANILGADEE